MKAEIPAEVLLRRVFVDGRERFALVHPIAYRDERHGEPHVVPADPESFRSDLTSVPFWFAWLVPRTGHHLLAALLHDGLVGCAGGRPTYHGPQVDRVEADLIFRRALIALGISRARAWLMWTAVALATVFAEGSHPQRLRVGAALVSVGVLGVIATGDLIEVWSVLPWMGERPWWQELASGAVASVLIPAALAPLWGRQWSAGVIAGVALAWLLHVSALVITLAGLFAVVERVSGRAVHQPTSDQPGRSLGLITRGQFARTLDGVLDAGGRQLHRGRRHKTLHRRER